MQLSARNFINFCHPESFNTCSIVWPFGVRRRNWNSQRCEGIKSTRRSFCQNVVLSLKCPVCLVSSLTLVFLSLNRSIHYSYKIHYFWALRIQHNGSHLSLADCSSHFNSVRWKILLSFTNLYEGHPDNCITDWQVKKYQDGALARLHDWKYPPFCVCWIRFRYYCNLLSLF
jgi:hypothetical protein